MNTVVSLLGATVVTFIASAAIEGKFDMVRVHCESYVDSERCKMRGYESLAILRVCSGVLRSAATEQPALFLFVADRYTSRMQPWQGEWR